MGWTHGDWVTFHDDGASVISGRSDATLNRGGVRMATGEFCSFEDAIPEIADWLVVHLDNGDRDELVLIVVCADGTTTSVTAATN